MIKKMILQMLFLLLCMLGSSFFAGTETGFVSWNPIKIQHRYSAGNVIARWAHFLMRHKDRLLSAVLIGNNICIVGASLAIGTVFESVDNYVSWNLTRLPSPESWLLTPFMVLFGEMLPKSLFRIYPFRLTFRSVPMLTGLYFITLPFTYVFTFLTGIFMKKGVKKGAPFMAKVREEMVLVAHEGSRSGTLFRNIDLFMQNVLEMNDRKVGDVIANESKKGEGVDRTFFRSDQSVGFVKKKVPEQSVILVYDSDSEVLCGAVSLLDLFDSSDDVLIGTLSRKLPQLEYEQTILTALRSIGDDDLAFYSVVDSARRCIGIIDTSQFLQQAFHNLN